MLTVSPITSTYSYCNVSRPARVHDVTLFNDFMLFADQAGITWSSEDSLFYLVADCGFLGDLGSMVMACFSDSEIGRCADDGIITKANMKACNAFLNKLRKNIELLLSGLLRNFQFFNQEFSSRKSDRVSGSEFEILYLL